MVVGTLLEYGLAPTIGIGKSAQNAELRVIFGPSAVDRRTRTRYYSALRIFRADTRLLAFRSVAKQLGTIGFAEIKHTEARTKYAYPVLTRKSSSFDLRHVFYFPKM